MNFASRPYTSSLREAHARDTRERIVRAAAECFSELAYAGTTLAAIATRAGVSVESVKQSGTKPQLLLASFELAFTGREGTDGVMQREELRALLESPDVGFLERLAAALPSFNAPVSRLWPVLLAAAAAEPAVKTVVDAMLVRRKKDYLDLVDVLAARGLVGSMTPRDRLADVLVFLLSPEGYNQLVGQAGWSDHEYSA